MRHWIKYRLWILIQHQFPTKFPESALIKVPYDANKLLVLLHSDNCVEIMSQFKYLYFIEENVNSLPNVAPLSTRYNGIRIIVDLCKV